MNSDIGKMRGEEGHEQPQGPGAAEPGSEHKDTPQSPSPYLSPSLEPATCIQLRPCGTA